MMKNTFEIENFGPIKKANINNTPLTIFIGPNSSGKSYSALLMHSLINSFNSLGSNLYSQIQKESIKRFLENDDEISNEFKESLIDYVNSQPTYSDNPFKFPAEKFKIILENSFGQVFNGLVESRLKSNFTNNLNKLNQLNKHSFKFSFNNNSFSNENGKLVLGDYCIDFNKIRDEGLSNENETISSFEIDEDFISVKLNYILWNKFFKDNNEFFTEVIFMMVVSSVMDTFNQTSYYIPAIGDELFKDINNIIANDINGTINLSNVQKELLINFLKVKDMEKSPFYKLANELEHELLDGEIQVKKDEIKDKIIFVDEECDMELELGLTSSSIRELTPLIIYLKYFLQKGNTLIIEEPENHIHPKNQFILVKYLVKAINEGLNIIITTHSEYIVEKFNNFIRLGNANDELFEKRGYEKNNILDYKNVSIYTFKKESKYSFTTEEVEINETGFDENSFYEVNNELYDESVDIIDAEKQ